MQINTEFDLMKESTATLDHFNFEPILNLVDINFTNEEFLKVIISLKKVLNTNRIPKKEILVKEECDQILKPICRWIEVIKKK